MSYHWRGWVEWFEDDGETVVCRMMDVHNPYPELQVAIKREAFAPSDHELLEGTYVDWIIADGTKPRILEIPPITEEQREEARKEAERLMEYFKEYDGN